MGGGRTQIARSASRALGILPRPWAARGPHPAGLQRPELAGLHCGVHCVERRLRVCVEGARGETGRFLRQPEVDLGPAHLGVGTGARSLCCRLGRPRLAGRGRPTLGVLTPHRKLHRKCPGFSSPIPSTTRRDLMPSLRPPIFACPEPF